MNLEGVLSLFRLPPDAVLERRVAKSDFADQLTKPADRRLVTDRIETLHWHAALNTTNTGLRPDGKPGLAVVTLVTRGDKPEPPPRLLALVHRAVPDPLILLTAHNTSVATTLSVKPSLGDILVADLPDTLPPQAVPLLAVDRAASMNDLHRRWTDAVLGIAAYRTTNTFPTPGGDAAVTRATLDRVVALDAEIRKLTAAARREKQAGRRAELNARLQDARRQRSDAAETL